MYRAREAAEERRDWAWANADRMRVTTEIQKQIRLIQTMPATN